MTDPAPLPTDLAGTPPWPPPESPPGSTPGSTPWPTPWPQAPHATLRPPGTVVAASVVTWTLASSTLLGTLLLVPAILWLGDPFFDAFAEDGSSMRLSIVTGAVVAVVLSAAADVIAWHVYRGRPWARWALVALSVVAGLVSLGWVLVFLLPGVITVGCIAVVVLLFVDPSPAWFRRAP